LPTITETWKSYVRGDKLPGYKLFICIPENPGISCKSYIILDA